MVRLEKKDFKPQIFRNLDSKKLKKRNKKNVILQINLKMVNVYQGCT